MQPIFLPAALNAANYAADMALAINADILLLHVYQIPVVYLEVPVVNEEDMMQEAEKDINKLKEELTRKTGGKLNIETEVRMGFLPGTENCLRTYKAIYCGDGQPGHNSSGAFVLWRSYGICDETFDVAINYGATSKLSFHLLKKSGWHATLIK